MEIFDRLPPHDIAAEQCLIGSMMLDKRAIDDALMLVDRDSFYQVDHQIVFDVIVKQHRDGKPIDAVIVRDALIKRGLYEEIGGVDGLSEMFRSVPSAAHAEHYAGIVREKSLYRKIISEANETLRAAYLASGSATDLAADTASRNAEIAAHGSSTDSVTIGEAVAGVYEGLESKAELRIETGLFELDDAIGGIPIGKFTLIGGRPGMGKSLLLKQMLRDMAMRGIPCGLVTIEESARKVAENFLSSLSGIDNYKIAFNKNICAEEWGELSKGVVKAGPIPFRIDDKPVRLNEVESAITRLVMKHKCRVVAVDYLQCIDAGIEQETREVTIISRALKLAFKRLNVAGIAAVQLNRGNETAGVRPPTLRDLRGSGALEQDGDVILMLHREDYYKKAEANFSPTHKLEVFIEKNKDNASGIVPLYFSGRTQEITDWNGGMGRTMRHAI